MTEDLSPSSSVTQDNAGPNKEPPRVSLAEIFGLIGNEAVDSLAKPLTYFDKDGFRIDSQELGRRAEDVTTRALDPTPHLVTWPDELRPLLTSIQSTLPPFYGDRYAQKDNPKFTTQAEGIASLLICLNTISEQIALGFTDGNIQVVDGLIDTCLELTDKYNLADLMESNLPPSVRDFLDTRRLRKEFELVYDTGTVEESDKAFHEYMSKAFGIDGTPQSQLDFKSSTWVREYSEYPWHKRDQCMEAMEAIELLRPGSVKALYTTYGITNFDWYRSEDLLRQLDAKERLDPKETTVILTARSSAGNEATYNSAVRSLYNDGLNEEVLFCEIGSLSELIKRISISRRNLSGQVENVVINSHGDDQGHVVLGAPQTRTKDNVQLSYITASQITSSAVLGRLSAGPRAPMVDDPSISLVICHAGNDRGIAKPLLKTWPKASITSGTHKIVASIEGGELLPLGPGIKTIGPTT